MSHLSYLNVRCCRFISTLVLCSPSVLHPALFLCDLCQLASSCCKWHQIILPEDWSFLFSWVVFSLDQLISPLTAGVPVQQMVKIHHWRWQGTRNQLLWLMPSSGLASNLIFNEASNLIFNLVLFYMVCMIPFLILRS